MADPLPMRASRELLLAFGVAALAIGLGAVAAGLTLSARGAELMTPSLPRVSRVLAPAPAATLTPFRERAMSTILVTNGSPAPAPAADNTSSQALILDSWGLRARIRVGLLPQEAQSGKTPAGAAPWDRIRLSSPRDPRAFLLGAAIQLHAPAAAARCGNDVAMPALEPGRVAPFQVKRPIPLAHC